LKNTHVSNAALSLLLLLALRLQLVSPTKSVPDREVLTIVVDELGVVNRVMLCTIHDKSVHDWVIVVNGDGPQIHQEEHDQVQILVNRKQEWIQVIRQSLQESIDGMESMTGVRSADHPAMVQFVNVGIDRWNMQSSVYPVYEGISEHQIPKDGNGLSEPSLDSVNALIQFCGQMNLRKEHDTRGNGHEDNGEAGNLNLLLHLLRKEQLVLHQILVKQEMITKGREGEIQDQAHNSGYYEERLKISLPQ